jgi:hypothetical protein
MADGGVISGPLLYSMIGAGAGAALDRKNPLRGLALGATGGYFAAPLLAGGALGGAGGTAATAAAEGAAGGAAAGGTGAATYGAATGSTIGGASLGAGEGASLYGAPAGMGLGSGGASASGGAYGANSGMTLGSTGVGTAGTGAAAPAGAAFNPKYMSALQAANGMMQPRQRAQMGGAMAPPLNPGAGAGQSFSASSPYAPKPVQPQISMSSGLPAGMDPQMLQMLMMRQQGLLG